MPWADIAPTGSSNLNFLSKNNIEKYTNAPPAAPIRTAAPADGALGPAVIATKPAIAPFIAIVTSIFPVIYKLINIAATTPPHAAMFVFMNT